MSCDEPPPGQGSDFTRTALALLSLGEGHHLQRFKAHQDAVKRGLGWLAERVFPAGPEGPPAQLTPRERILGAWAFLRAAETSRTRRRLEPLARASLRLLSEVWESGARLSPEEAAWAAFALSPALARAPSFPRPRLAIDGPWEWQTRALELLYDARPLDDPGRAVSSLRLRGEWLPDPGLMEIDMCALIGALISARDARSRAWVVARQEALIASRRASGQGCLAGSWDPAGGMDRVERTARAILELELTYRAERVWSPR